MADRPDAPDLADGTGSSVLPLAGVACLSSALLMTELALTRIFSVVMYYHFAFLAISIALFGLSASGVYAFIRREALARRDPARQLAARSLVFAGATIVALFALVRLRVGLNYSLRNLWLMLTIYALAAVPFFTGGLVVTLALTRMSRRINTLYAADLLGAAAGCLILLPLLDVVGAPGVVVAAAVLGSAAAVAFAPAEARRRMLALGLAIVLVPVVGQLSGLATFDVTDTKGHEGDRILFSKWNSFSRIGVYEREHGDWSLSPAYTGPKPQTRFMDIDSAASTPILSVAPDLSNVQYLRYELTGLAYHLMEPRAAGPGGFTALVIGPGGGRDIVSALVFGAKKVDGVEINPIIARDVMSDRFREFSGGIYTHPKVHVVVDDGRSYVSRSAERYDVIQASLVDTWAATAAGAYTLTENTLYTVEAFTDYYDHLTDDGMLTITRWVFDGLRLVSLAQEACARRGCDPRRQLAIVRQENVATFLFKRSPFTAEEIAQLRTVCERLRFQILYAPSAIGDDAPASRADGAATAEGPAAETPARDAGPDYARLILAPDREAFYRAYRQDIRPTTDDRPFFFHTTKLSDQFGVAFGRSMLFGNGLSALLTLMGISGGLVLLFVLVPLVIAGGYRSRRWLPTLAYFGALGTGFMLVEVAILQRFVLLLGHPVYSLTVTLFSLLLGTGLGAAWSRRLGDARLVRAGLVATLAIAVLAVSWMRLAGPLLDWAMPFSRTFRIGVAVVTLLPVGFLLGIPMPTGLRLVGQRSPQMLPWAWGMNGAFSVVGATLAIFVAMNWGFQFTLASASGIYLIALISLGLSERPA